MFRLAQLPEAAPLRRPAPAASQELPAPALIGMHPRLNRLSSKPQRRFS